MYPIPQHRLVPMLPISHSSGSLFVLPHSPVSTIESKSGGGDGNAAMSVPGNGLETLAREVRRIRSTQGSSSSKTAPLKVQVTHATCMLDHAYAWCIARCVLCSSTASEHLTAVKDKSIRYILWNPNLTHNRTRLMCPKGRAFS